MGFFSGLFAGRKRAQFLADQIGLKRSLFDAAMLEMGVQWRHLAMLEKHGQTHAEAVVSSAALAYIGLQKLQRRIGETQELSQAIRHLPHTMLASGFGEDFKSAIEGLVEAKQHGLL